MDKPLDLIMGLVDLNQPPLIEAIAGFLGYFATRGSFNALIAAIDTSPGETFPTAEVRLFVINHHYLIVDDANGYDGIGPFEHFKGVAGAVKEYLRPLVDIKDFAMEYRFRIIWYEDATVRNDFLHTI